MLSADHRLRDSDSFRRTVRSGRRAGSPALVVHLDAEAGAPSVRVGFVVSKAVGNAVVRNRVKRRLREIVKHSLTALPAGSVLVVRALPPAAGSSSAELGAELARCLQRVTRREPLSATRTAAGTGAAS